MDLLKKIEQKRKKQKRAEQNKKAALAAVGVATGAIAGAAAGVLLAPKAGKETVSDIKEKSKNAKEKLTANVSESKVKIREYLDNRKAQKSIESEEVEASNDDNEIEEVEA